MMRRFAAWWRGWRYHWSPATRLEPVRVGEGDPRFGSMQLDEDWAPSAQDAWAAMVTDSRWATCSMLNSSPMTAELDWREQTMAELSPEALEHPQGPQAAVSWGAGPGPGAGSSSASGPALALNVALPGPGVGDGIEWAVNAAISPHIERLADTGEIASARQLAEWDADLRAQDDDAARYLAGLGFECERYRLEMAEALA